MGIIVEDGPNGLLGELNSHQFYEVDILPSSRKYVHSMRSGRIIASLALALMMLLPGCLEEVASTEQEVDWNRDYVLIDPSGHEDLVCS